MNRIFQKMRFLIIGLLSLTASTAHAETRIIPNVAKVSCTTASGQIINASTNEASAQVIPVQSATEVTAGS